MGEIEAGTRPICVMAGLVAVMAIVLTFAAILRPRIAASATALDLARPSRSGIALTPASADPSAFSTLQPSEIPQSSLDLPFPSYLHAQPALR